MSSRTELGSFNLIHTGVYLKVDVFPASGAFEKQAIARALTIALPGADEKVSLATREDISLAKLRWFRAGGPRWPPQIPPAVAGSNSPTQPARDMVMLRSVRLLRNACGGLFEAPAFALEFEQMAMMQQAVEQGRDDDGIAE